VIEDPKNLEEDGMTPPTQTPPAHPRARKPHPRARKPEGRGRKGDLMPYSIWRYTYSTTPTGGATSHLLLYSTTLLYYSTTTYYIKNCFMYLLTQ
jgi:hypothetical protein